MLQDTLNDDDYAKLLEGLQTTEPDYSDMPVLHRFDAFDFVVDEDGNAVGEQVGVHGDSVA